MNDRKSTYEKREKRRNIRQLQNHITQGNVGAIKEIFASNSNFEVDFHYGAQTSLQLAVCKGSPQICSLLIEKGANVNQVDVEGNSLLNMACHRGFVEIAEILVKNGADLNSQNEARNSALHACAFKGHLRIAKILLDAKCNLDLTNHRGHTALYCVSQNGNFNFVKCLLDAGADPNWWDHSQQTPLMVAAEGGHAAVVSELFSKGADAKIKSRHGKTAVFEAASKGHTDVLELLIQYKANLDDAKVNGHTPLLESIVNFQLDAAKLLVKSGCNVNLADRRKTAPMHAVIMQAATVFSASTKEDMRPLVEILLESSADVNICDGDGLTPLYQAALYGELELCKVLLNNGASLNSVTKSGDSVLHAAIRGQVTEVVRLLLHAGCDVNQVNDRGEHPLITAVSFKSHIEIIRLLLESHSDVNITVKNTKETALHVALSWHYPAAALLLISHGSDLVAVTDQKQSPLYLACQSGLIDVTRSILKHGCPASGPHMSALPIHAAAVKGNGTIIELLSEYGCDLNETNQKGQTPLMTAITDQCFSAVRALLQCGCDLTAHWKTRGYQVCCLYHDDGHPHFGLEPLFLAMSQKSLDMMRMLLQCYEVIPYKVIRLLATLLLRTEEMSMHYSQSQKVAITRLFTEYTRVPFSLMDICRRNIRARLGVHIQRKVKELPVGGKVQSYILMEEEFKGWMDKEQDKVGGSTGSWDVVWERRDVLSDRSYDDQYSDEYF